MKTNPRPLAPDVSSRRPGQSLDWLGVAGGMGSR